MSEEDQFANFNAESFNSWRYGDEASLYSIAEDSREDRQSEALSRAGMSDHAATLSTVSGGDRPGHVRGGSSGAFTLSGINPWRGSDNGDDSDDSDDDDQDSGPFEVKWVTDEEMDTALSEMPPILSSGQDFSRMYFGPSVAAAAAADASAGSNSRRGGGGGTKALAAPSVTSKTGALLRHTPSSSDEEEDSYTQMLGYRLNARPYRRLVIVACFMCVAITGTVLAVVLTAADNESTGGGQRSPGGSDGGENNFTIDDDSGGGGVDSWDNLDPPSPSPTTPATSQPTADYSEIIAEAAQEFAYESISACPYADSSEFFDITVPQAEVFQELIIELKKAAKVSNHQESSSSSANGGLSVDFESTHGMGYLLERWALLMLFFSTNGEYWDRNDKWYTDSDVCEWEAALLKCEPRVQGEAAMTYLDLHSFGLVGTIPKELCCMPKLKELYLYSNSLTGEVPECLSLMGLDVIDLSNNNFNSNSSTGNTDVDISPIAMTNSVMNDPPPP